MSPETKIVCHWSEVRDVSTQNLNLLQKEVSNKEEVSNMKLCRAHCLGKPNRSRAWPLIACFTCRDDIDRVWMVHYWLKNLLFSKGGPCWSTYKKLGKGPYPCNEEDKTGNTTPQSYLCRRWVSCWWENLFWLWHPKKMAPCCQHFSKCPLAIVQLNIKNHCQVKENPLMFCSNVKLRTA